MKTIVGVKFKKPGKMYYFDPQDLELEVGTKVIVETALGDEYGVKIVGYEVMEKEKYFSKYDLSGNDQSVADPFSYIMEVTIKIKNEENETGKLQIADWALIGKNDDFIAYLDQQLLMDTDERVDSILSSISTASGKEIEIKLPYPLIYMDKEKEIDRNMPYKIAVTKYPSRKYIQFG